MNLHVGTKLPLSIEGGGKSIEPSLAGIYLHVYGQEYFVFTKLQLA